MTTIRTLAALREVYPNEPLATSVAKESPVLTAGYRELIAASPFCVITTVGDGGLDASPRGDAPGFVRIADERTLVIPDRRGNNRLDTLRNVIADPRVGVLFLVPGLDHEVRVRGTATITTDSDELARHEVQGKRPASCLVVSVHRVYFQCGRAIKRSKLWSGENIVDRADMPTAGRLTEEAGGFTAAERRAYDEALEARQNATLY